MTRQQSVRGPKEFGEAIRLGQCEVGAHGALRIAGHDKNRKVRRCRIRSNPPDELIATHHRYVHIGHEQIGARFLHPNNGMSAVFRFIHVMTSGLEPLPPQSTLLRITFDDQNPGDRRVIATSSEPTIRRVCRRVSLNPSAARTGS